MTEIPLLRRHIAHAFKSNLPLEQILVRLNGKGPWRWQMRDGHYDGEYLRTHETRELDFRRLQVFQTTDGFVFDVLFESDEPRGEEGWEALARYVRTDLLPALDAVDVQDTAPHD